MAEAKNQAFWVKEFSDMLDRANATIDVQQAEIERLRGKSRRLTTFVAMIAEQNCLEDAANGCDCFACLVRHDAERVLASGPGGNDADT